MKYNPALRSLLLFFTLLSFAMVYVGCGGSEEMMAEDEMVTDTGAYEETPTEEQQPPEEQAAEEQQEEPTEEQPVEQEQPAETPQEVTEQPAQVSEGPTREQLQADLDALKTENIQLKEQLAASEQVNRDLTAKVSDLEAANMALKRSETQRPSQAGLRPSAAGKSSPEEIQAYENAVGMFNSKRYRDVISEMQTLLNMGIKEDYADNCHYWMGLSYFQLKEFPTAIDHLNQVMNFRYSQKRDDAQYMIARAYERTGEKEKALSEYKKLIDMYPTSEYVGRARAKLH